MMTRTMGHTPAALAAAAMMMSALATGAMAQDAASGTPGPDTVVATVDGTDITLGHMIVLRERLPEQYRDLPAQTLFDGILEQLVQQTALAASVPAPSERTDLVIENERRSLMAAEAIEIAASAAVTDAALQAAYDAAYAQAEPQTEWNASHILVETEEEAQALVTELDGGADFAELATEKSTGPSGPSGGELGWFGPGMMVGEFEAAVADMEVGAISAPVQTQFGWHVLKLNDTRQKDAPSLDEVRDELTATVQREAAEVAIAAAEAGAEIVRSASEGLDPEVLNDPTILPR